MTAGDSHWQLGRAEAHGRIGKQMLTAMDMQSPIHDEAEFQRCLRHVFSAKPEQALLGKARALPGSLVADEQSAAHSLLDSNTPDGEKFREDVERRARAKRAFLNADNDHAIRRALLRRSRIDHPKLEKGDWVLYWRSSKGNIKGDRGRCMVLHKLWP